MNCAFCDKKTESQSFRAYTGKLAGSKVEDEDSWRKYTTTYTDFREHVYGLCDSCKTKWRWTIPAIIFVIAIILAIPFMFLENTYEGISGLLGIALILSIIIWSQLSAPNIERRIARKSATLRKKQDPSGGEYKGFTVREYQKMIKSEESVDTIESVDALIEALKNEQSNYQVRMRAAEALGEFKSEEVIVTLIEALKDREKLVRQTAAEALGKFGDERGIEPLFQAVQEVKSSLVRQHSILAIAEIGDTETIEPIRQLLNDKKWFVRDEAKQALQKLESRRTEGKKE